MGSLTGRKDTLYLCNISPHYISYRWIRLFYFCKIADCTKGYFAFGKLSTALLYWLSVTWLTSHIILEIIFQTISSIPSEWSTAWNKMAKITCRWPNMFLQSPNIWMKVLFVSMKYNYHNQMIYKKCLLFKPLLINNDNH